MDVSNVAGKKKKKVKELNKHKNVNIVIAHSILKVNIYVEQPLMVDNTLL